MMALLVLLLVMAIFLWPRGRPVPRTGWPGGAGPAPDAGALSVRVRALLSREVQFRRERRGWVADFAELSAVGLDAGLPAAEAARLACEVGGSAARSAEFADLAARIADAQAHGHGVGGCLRDAAEGDRDLAFLGAAWQLTDEFGVAAAPAARVSAAVLRERTASDDRRTVLAAGPRASMWLLTLLPLSGPLVAVVLGFPVLEVYGSTPALAAATVGLGLTGLGWFWSRTVLRRALRPAEIS
ncbi:MULTISPECIES: type II secretion system F family protein [unclassified Knoellia]|uniref:type II secretion system F family protein n=1 Tax=Knoellia altitudinis TaxID=3404795 RepID=UPI00361C782B